MSYERYNCMNKKNKAPIRRKFNSLNVFYNYKFSGFYSLNLIFTRI
jgi:hypothetical protein